MVVLGSWEDWGVWVVGGAVWSPWRSWRVRGCGCGGPAWAWQGEIPPAQIGKVLGEDLFFCLHVLHPSLLGLDAWF